MCTDCCAHGPDFRFVEPEKYSKSHAFYRVDEKDLAMSICIKFRILGNVYTQRNATKRKVVKIFGQWFST